MAKKKTSESKSSKSKVAGNLYVDEDKYNAAIKAGADPDDARDIAKGKV